MLSQVLNLSRLAETVHLDNTFRDKPYEKAEILNNYFLIHRTIILYSHNSLSNYREFDFDFI